MGTQAHEPDESTEEFRDSALDQDHVAQAFEEMEAAPEGGALLEGESTADEHDDHGHDDDGHGDHGHDDDHDSGADDSADDEDDVGGGADVASGGGAGEREPMTGAVGGRQDATDDPDDGAGR